MADSPPYPDSREHTGVPRWVKVLGIVAVVAILLVVVMLLIGGGGEHGPGRHTPPSGAGGSTPAVSVSESGGPGGHTPPEGGHG